MRNLFKWLLIATFVFSTQYCIQTFALADGASSGEGGGCDPEEEEEETTE